MYVKYNLISWCEAHEKALGASSFLNFLIRLRYHGRWIFMKNVKNLLLAVQIEKTEIIILPKEWGEKHFYFLR